MNSDFANFPGDQASLAPTPGWQDPRLMQEALRRSALSSPDGSVIISQQPNGVGLQARPLSDVFATAALVGQTIKITIEGVLLDPLRTMSGHHVHCQSSDSILIDTIDWAAIESSTDEEPGTIWFVYAYQNFTYSGNGQTTHNHPGYWGNLSAVVSADLSPVAYHTGLPGLSGTNDFQKIVISDLHHVHDKTPLTKIFGIRLIPDGSGGFDSFELLQPQGRTRVINEQPIPFGYTAPSLEILEDDGRGRKSINSPTHPYSARTQVLPANATTSVYINYRYDIPFPHGIGWSDPELGTDPADGRLAAIVETVGSNIYTIDHYIGSWDIDPGFTPPTELVGLQDTVTVQLVRAGGGEGDIITLIIDPTTGRVIGAELFEPS